MTNHPLGCDCSYCCRHRRQVNATQCLDIQGSNQREANIIRLVYFTQAGPGLKGVKWSKLVQKVGSSEKTMVL